MAESRADNQTSNQTGTTRRSVVRGAAWSVPVVAAAAAAPAFAASPIPCPVVPPGSTWNVTTSGTLGRDTTGGYTWDGASWSVYRDNGSTSATLTFTTTPQAPVAVVPGATYQVSFSFFWGYGNGNPNQSTGGTFDVLFNGQSVKSLATRTAAVDANAGTNGVQPGTTTQTFTYVVPAGQTSMTIAYRYILQARTQQSNDDIVVGPLQFTACTVN